jgi:cellobiose phosphorylase
MNLPYTFDDANRAIQVHRYDLPTPWINYLSNGNLHAFVSHAGGGLAWWRTPSKARLTRYRMTNLPIDTPGFYVYLREADGTVWSPSFRPVETPLDAWHAEHQPGLTRYVARRGALEATLELFIPPNTQALVWDLSIKNASGQEVALDVFGYVEFCLMDWKQDTDWSCYVKHNLHLWYEAEANAVLYLYRHFHFNPWLENCPLAYFGASEPVVSHACDRDAFVGNYRWEKNPLGVERNDCGNTDLLCGEPCGALQNKITVPAHGEKRMHYFLGAEPKAIVEWPKAKEGVIASMQSLRQPGVVDQLKAELRAWWDEHLGCLQCQVPDADVQRQINIWSPVQSVHTGRYSRSISLYASGVRTLGYRDTCQDMMAVAYRKPAWATDVFSYLLSQQYEDGHAPHQCNPVENLPAEARVHIDNPIWLPMLANAILSETGDLSLLDRELPWLSAKDNLSPVGSATVWQHLLRVTDFIEANLGAHGIPLTHKGDWNDSIGKYSKKGHGESLMAAQQYVYSLGLLAGMAAARGEREQAARLQALRTKQAEAILACAWDGAWWRRGFDDAGKPFGTVNDAYGKIWLNTQSWAVIAGVGSVEQQKQALQSVKDMLDTGVCGIQKLFPSYASFPASLDPYSGYSPGCGENGAIFCHANTWAIIAEALAGNSERAWHYYRQLIPHVVLQKVGLQTYQAEPYAYVSNIIGPENPRYGWANVTQVTGTAAWMDIAATQYLLGLRPELGGLRIAPALPPSWEGFSAVRQFRGCRIEIKVQRGSSPGLVVNDQKLAENLVPAALLLKNAALQATLTV